MIFLVKLFPLTSGTNLIKCKQMLAIRLKAILTAFINKSGWLDWTVHKQSTFCDESKQQRLQVALKSPQRKTKMEKQEATASCNSSTFMRTG